MTNDWFLLDTRFTDGWRAACENEVTHQCLADVRQNHRRTNNTGHRTGGQKLVVLGASTIAQDMYQPVQDVILGGWYVVAWLQRGGGALDRRVQWQVTHQMLRNDSRLLMICRTWS